MRIQIVNEKDEIIECKERNKLADVDIHRITNIWVFNKNRDFLIAKRQSTKRLSPNKWGPSVAGTLEEGETYESNAKKEIEEEIGLKNALLVPLKKIYYEYDNRRRFCFIFTTSVNIRADEFTLQRDEVAEVKWISLDELSEWYKKSPENFIPSMGNTINLVKQYQDENQS